MKIKIIEAIKRFQDDAKIRPYEIHLNYKDANFPNVSSYMFSAYLVGISINGSPIFQFLDSSNSFIALSKEEIKHLILKE